MSNHRFNLMRDCSSLLWKKELHNLVNNCLDFEMENRNGTCNQEQNERIINNASVSHEIFAFYLHTHTQKKEQLLFGKPSTLHYAITME